MHAHTHPPSPSSLPFPLLAAFVQIAQILRPNWKVLAHISLYLALFHFIFHFPVRARVLFTIFICSLFCWLPTVSMFGWEIRKFTRIYAANSVVTQAISMQTANFINYFDLVCISPTQAKGVELGHKFGHCLPLHSNNWASKQTKCSLSCSRAVKRGRAGCKLRFHANKAHFNSDN